MTLKIIDNDSARKENKIEIIKLSSSSIKTYEQCPAKYKFTYIEKLPRREWDHLTLGNLCHKTLEIFHRIYMNDGNKMGTLNKLMAHSFIEAKKDFDKISISILDEAKLLLLEYLKYVSKNGMPLVKGVETSFNFNIGDSVLLRGFIDRIDITNDGKFRIVDYKTTKNVKYLDTFQLLIYGMWLKKQYPEIESFRASYVLLRHGSKTKDYEFNIEDIKKTEKDILNYANKIKSENQWLTVPSGLCKFCDFEKVCPASKAW